MAKFTQLRPFGATRKRYNSFAGRVEAGAEQVKFTQLRPFGATRKRYSSFAGRVDGGPVGAYEWIVRARRRGRR